MEQDMMLRLKNLPGQKEHSSPKTRTQDLGVRDAAKKD